MRWQCDECDDVGYISRFLRLTLRMYGFVGWKDLGTMVVREGTSSMVACRTVNDFVGDAIVVGGLVMLLICRGKVSTVYMMHTVFTMSPCMMSLHLL